MAEKGIFGLVDGPETAGAYLANDAIARVEERRREKRADGFADRNGSVGGGGWLL